MIPLLPMHIETDFHETLKPIRISLSEKINLFISLLVRYSRLPEECVQRIVKDSTSHLCLLPAQLILLTSIYMRFTVYKFSSKVYCQWTISLMWNVFMSYFLFKIFNLFINNFTILSPFCLSWSLLVFQINSEVQLHKLSVR